MRRYHPRMRILLAMCACSLAAQAVTDAERQRALAELAASRARLIASVESLTAEQWKFKPAPDRWSAAECVEHITVTELRILGGVMKSLAAPPSPAKFDRAKDEVILARMPDRSTKAQAPEEIRPVGRPEFATPKAAIAAFEKARTDTVQFVRETPVDLRAHGFPHFAFGELDAYQWILLLSGHCERHRRQIEEVKASPGWPK